jgi:hypothetical protein
MVLIPTGEYGVKVDSVEEETGQFGPQLKWKLEIVAGEYKGQQLTAWTGWGPKLGVKSKTVEWAKACGIDLEAGESLDTNDLYGEKAVAVIIVARKKSDGTEFNKVETLRARKRSEKSEAKAEEKPAKDKEDPFE